MEIIKENDIKIQKEKLERYRNTIQSRIAGAVKSEIRQGREATINLDIMFEKAENLRFRCYSCNLKLLSTLKPYDNRSLRLGKIIKSIYFTSDNTTIVCGSCNNLRKTNLLKYKGPEMESDDEDEKEEDLFKISDYTYESLDSYIGSSLRDSKCRYKETPFEIDTNIILIKLKECGGKCWICETTIRTIDLGPNLKDMISILRDDLELGFTSENIFICCNGCALYRFCAPKYVLKLNHKYKQIPDVLEIIYEIILKNEKSSDNLSEIVEPCEVNDICLRYITKKCKALKRDDEKDGISSNLTANHAITILKRLNFKCDYCGIDLSRTPRTNNILSPSIDRKINSDGHNDGNITICCKHCNDIKKIHNYYCFKVMMKYKNDRETLNNILKAFI